MNRTNNALKKKVITSNFGRTFQSLDLFLSQGSRLLKQSLDLSLGDVTANLEACLLAAGVDRVEPSTLDVRALAPAEQHQWTWFLASTTIHHRQYDGCMVGLPHGALRYLTEFFLGLHPQNMPTMMDEYQPSETEIRLMRKICGLIQKNFIRQHPAMAELAWEYDQHDPNNTKGFVIQLLVTVDKHKFPIVLCWPQTFSLLLDQFVVREERPHSLSPEAIQKIIEKIPVKLNAELLKTRVSFAEVEDMQAGKMLPITLPEKVFLKKGTFVLATGKVFEYKGNLVFQLAE
ncbi:MAG: FliM/FliN family flagellar motor switch protein [Plesiomonas sp.]